jgi:uncharacterized membrane protein YjgN (DUF898 family)
MDTAPALTTQNSAVSSPQPLSTIEDHAVQFTGSGSEYFRIWIVNLLLILVTLGIYMPWAKVRKTKYFYGNTLLNGDALDYHADPRKMLRAYLIVGGFFIAFSVAAQFSGVAYAIAIGFYIVLWPILYRASQRFRLANTSWRGIRGEFRGSTMKEAYWCLGLPLLLAFLPLLVITLGVDPEAANEAAREAAKAGQKPADPFEGPMGAIFGAAMLVLGLFYLAVPFFLWRIERFVLGHSAWGPLQTQMRADVGRYYGVFIQWIGVSIGLMIGVGIAFAIGALIFGASMGRGNWGVMGLIGLIGLMLMGIFVNAFLKGFLTAKLQNLVWSQTGNRHVRFVSRLAVGGYCWLQFKNFLLLMLTLGLYWPFAVIANRRMRLEAVTLRTRVALEQIVSAAQRKDGEAAGDAAMDVFDFDLGF